MKTVKTSVHRSFSFRKSGGNYYICYYVDFEGVRIPISPLIKNINPLLVIV